MSGEGHPPDCPDCTACRACDQPAWCVSEHPVAIPCPHLEPLCGECLLDTDGCLDCQLDAEIEMHRTGEYSAAADPFYLPTGREPQTLAEVAAQGEEDVEAYRASTGFDPDTNTYQRGNAP